VFPEPKRARRIRDKLRMKAKAVRVYSRLNIHDQDPERVAVNSRRYIKLADHIKSCSCHMCRNPRRSHFFTGADRLTLQERRFAEGWGGLG